MSSINPANVEPLGLIVVETKHFEYSSGIDGAIFGGALQSNETENPKIDTTGRYPVVSYPIHDISENKISFKKRPIAILVKVE